MLSQVLRAEKPRRSGTLSMSSLGARRVEVAPGKQVTLAVIGQRWFGEHDQFEADMKRVKKTLVGTVRDSVEVHELRDAFVLVRATGATVSDPDALRKASPLFASLTKNRKTKVQIHKLSKQSKKGLKQFKAHLRTRPGSDPLRQAMQKGDQALLDALADGVGEMSVVDTLIVPKRAPSVAADGRLMVPTMKAGIPDYGATTPLGIGKVAGIDKNQLGLTDAGAERVADAIGLNDTGHVVSGVAQTKAEFIAGRTWADSWDWERTFYVPSGFLRVKLGAHYAVGLRVPIEVEAKLDPIYVCENGRMREQNSHRFNVRTKVRAVDGDVGFYRRAGMPNDLIADGKELALGAGVGYSVKLRLFWETLVDRPYTEHGFDWGRDFDPPEGSRDVRVAEVFLPSHLTRTRLNFGPLKGSVRFGLRVDVHGQVNAHLSGFQAGDLRQALRRPSGSTSVAGGNPKNSPQRMVFRDGGWKLWEFGLLNHAYAKGRSTPSYSERFGYQIDHVSYDSSWSVVPGVKVHASASYAGYGIGGTWTYWLETARLPVGSLNLTHHPGTRTQLRSDRGLKVWHLNRVGDTDYCGRV